jgi:hypothetical protein
LPLAFCSADTLRRSEGPMVVHTYMAFQYTPLAPGGRLASMDSCTGKATRVVQPTC